MDAIEADFFQLELSEGDMVLMCSDGLTNMVEDSRIFEILKDEETENKGQVIFELIGYLGG